MIGKTLATAAAAILAAAPVVAQVGPFAQSVGKVEARATIGITVPLGGRRGDIASRPRAELRLGQGAQVNRIGSERPTLRAVGLRGADSFAPAPGAVAITLGSNPRWLAGGRVLGVDQDETPEDDDGIDTLEGIGIGVGVVLAVAAIGVVVLINIADCGYEEECN